MGQIDGIPGGGGVSQAVQPAGDGVDRVLRNLSADEGGPDAETDLLVVNGDLVVGVEVKATLRVKAVKRFLQVLGNYRNLYSEYKGQSYLRGGGLLEGRGGGHCICRKTGALRDKGHRK